MKALFSIASLVIVLCVVALVAQRQLRASRALLPQAQGGAAGPAGASAPFGGTSQPSVAQFQRELDRTLQEGARQRASDVDAAESSR
jgi:hypothetical protein